jgi:hypothetical protein
MPSDQDCPSVDDTKARRRPLQFSLRKLMLWTLVWAVYLTFFVRQVRTYDAIFFTVELVLIAAIRLKWGLDSGMKVAALANGVCLGCIGVYFRANLSFLFLPVVFLSSFAVGAITGWIAIWLIEGLVRCVDLLDNWMES